MGALPKHHCVAQEVGHSRIALDAHGFSCGMGIWLVFGAFPAFAFFCCFPSSCCTFTLFSPHCCSSIHRICQQQF